ncbi:GPW/gp25 family protein [Motiliproteus sp.]|uniref:GPW/gp25 family protein n=1 Tax=Motiliproteus sp. TaxID=1898955 RepID=UPI003BAA99A5
MTGMNNSNGTRLADEMAHVQQSVFDILTTPVGSRVMRRDYGSVLPELIDQPLNERTLLRLYAATVAALMTWEPRLKIAQIRFITPAHASAVIEVAGSVGNQTLTTTVQLRG